MKPLCLFLTIIFLSCCAKQHGSETKIVPNSSEIQTVSIGEISPAVQDNAKPLMIGGKQFGKYTLGDNLDEIKHIGLDIDPLNSSKRNSLEGIEQLYNAQNLVSIWFHGMNLDTVDLSPLERFTNITELELDIWGNAQVLPDLTAFKSLRKLVISVGRFEQPYTLNVPSGLTSLSLDCNDLHNVDLSFIETLHDLHSLWLNGNIVKLPDLTGLENLRFIKMGSTGYRPALESLEGIGAPNAEEIRITNSRKIDSLAPLNNLLNLEHLEISSPWEGECNLENLPSLKYLKLTEISMDGKVNLHGIVNLPNLRHLEIGIFGKIDLQDIEKLQSLEYLNIYYPEDVSIEGIGKLKNLKFLRIPLISPEPSLESLRNLPNLTKLSFSGSLRDGEVYQVLDLAPLATLKNLRELNCSYFIIKNISALDGLESLCISDDDVYVLPFIGLEGCRLYDETEKSRHYLMFDFSILSE